MKRRLLARRPSPAMMVAVIALVSSLTGGALAATLITTGDIKNGAVTKKKLHKNSVNSKKVKNKTLKAKDFADGQLEQGVQGIQGLKGDKGEKGDDGEQGPRGPSNAYSAFRNGPVTLPNTGGTLATLADVPAGSYVINAKVWMDSSSASVRTVTCVLATGTDSDESRVRLNTAGNPGEIAAMPLQVVHTASDPFNTTLSCSYDGGAAANVVAFNDMKITATQVESLSNTAVTG